MKLWQYFLQERNNKNKIKGKEGKRIIWENKERHPNEKKEVEITKQKQKVVWI